MRIDIITCLPELFEGPMNQSIVKRAQKKGLVELYIHDLRPFTSNKQKSIDDYAYGGGAGMVMMIEPIDRCISALKKHTAYDEIIFMTPDGEKLNQSTCNQLSLNKNIILLCGHYKGIDQRVRDHLITREISIGDYVLSGGELAAMIVADSLIRLIPGVLNDESSALTDSFQDDLLAPPVYTRPAVYNGWEVPKILLSGNEAVINDWRHEAAVKKTKERRPHLLN
ncbi:tRNA (guanosine(37)-N1)-methyltransferase TrmD [Cyclobacteriaceae bacterium]|nr:tRNA (guanosine(37)-N1)-methyltransferase TrmD [Cyclobacteriaceae bacterium]MDB4013303.1 tRNA (guanosine(37)-N1)-methyltransferase TrmD [Cyclobacteriaceae bacterium]MDB4605992.1 tRNA (guanosine(37)-N1)-methyltransferase TrmD [Cyclobacteriaceae bacterium]MDB4742012.1 tRNA (guanosine(37)-N1)-methyltransferase TrmD [Cyclobacteriaceae bacterium]MDB9883907.1 tRNA (guanosine(37)-N1)-methyltransferase TrmD [Cyclobacteriaceae bacterium]